MEKQRFMCDFETSTWEDNRTHVWAWACCEIGNETNIQYGNNIKSFMKFCENNKGSELFFHNLKFDGEFIIYYLIKKGFIYVKNQKEAKNKSYSTIISDMGQFYQIEIYFEKTKTRTTKITIRDSLKIIPFNVDKCSECFGLEESKLKIDYKKPRRLAHRLSEEEINYIKNDVVIMAKSLNIIFKEGLTKMTRAANALYDFKKDFSNSKWNHFFPDLSLIDKDIRQAYKGGFTYLNPKYKEKIVGQGCVLDVNSLYPYCLREKLMPYGQPKFFEGKYENDKDYPLYIQMIRCNFKIKKNKIPTIQLKNNPFYLSNQYLCDCFDDEPEILCLTNVDLKLFLEQYEIKDNKIEFLSGWKFKGIHGLFNNYIDKWIEIKNEATIEGNEGMRTLAKLMLNSLYGKFAKTIEIKSKYPIIDEEDVIHYPLGELEIKKPIYLPIGIFTTSYAREMTIRSSQQITDYSIEKYGIDLYCYSDTDSIHTLLPIEELKNFCHIDKVELGAWKHEGTFSKAKFIRQKCYIEEIENKIKITCAGMPKDCYKSVTFENFSSGLTVPGKLDFKHVKGGVKLEETPFTIKEEIKKERRKNEFRRIN